jgi:hypothetical protein
MMIKPPLFSDRSLFSHRIVVLREILELMRREPRHPAPLPATARRIKAGMDGDDSVAAINHCALVRWTEQILTKAS